MKRIVIIVVVFLAVLSITSLIAIPSVINVSSVCYIKMYPTPVNNFLTNQDTMTNWFNKFISQNPAYQSKDFSIKVEKTYTNITTVNIKLNESEAVSHIISKQIHLDSTGIQWFTEINAGNNPVSRIKSYLKAKELKSKMSEILNKLQKDLNSPYTFYGIKIDEVQQIDTAIITTKYSSKQYPTTEEIYQTIEKLNSYASQNHATVTNHPMLFVNKISDSNYEVMIGLPLNKPVPNSGAFLLKGMPYRGNMLVTEVTGGPATIKNAFTELQLFFNDSKRSSPAIPFEQLITNRLTEKDTLQWKTKIFYPVI